MKTAQKSKSLMRPKEPTPTVVWCDDEAQADKIYKGIIDCARKNMGELNVVVKVGDKQHFASLPLYDVFQLLHSVADAFAEDFNKKLTAIDAK